MDRGSIEVFANEGQLALSSAGLFAANKQGITLTMQGGMATFAQFSAMELASAWPQEGALVSHELAG